MKRIRHETQLALFPQGQPRVRTYAGGITALENIKGVMDVDTVKGCSLGMAAYPGRGCYGDCYAARIARYRGFDFSVSVLRRFSDREHLATIRNIINRHREMWYRVGVHGDPSFNWSHTLHVLKYLWPTGKIPVVITKHWLPMSDAQARFMARLKAVVHTSASGMDTDTEIAHRLGQAERLRALGVYGVVRVVTCKFGDSEWAKDCARRQDRLMQMQGVIDNPFRPSKSNPRVLSGEVVVEYRPDSIGGRYVSMHRKDAYLGHCSTCLDQCGVNLGLCG